MAGERRRSAERSADIVSLDPVISDPALALLVLLVAGHLLGDCLPRPRERSAGGGPEGSLLLHVGFVLVVHLAVAAPFAGLHMAAAVLAIGLLHALVDWLKRRVTARGRKALVLLAIDQVAHISVIVAVWVVLVEVAGAPAVRIAAAGLEAWVTASVVLAAFAFNATGGSAIVAGVLGSLAREAEEADPAGTAGSGRLIGILERTITLILIMAGQWAAMALLATAKSVARFDELKEREFAEYYLVGTLTSLLVAILIGLGLTGLGI